ncbi:MAG: penicillin acylase family protein [Acidibrevibacterium sp.]|uniref:penicillin acylase family protein n=1 Tax=Acidibrevibacterium fodinaquatile TaxID=1969806 RepID=UPI0023A7944D|nr:penicillin acylase family protein [Acidibrevibacterium fodinaquatile]MCA7118537.1 penicillin acylase family protein [Acidibrevibacterium fodinaquatile]
MKKALRLTRRLIGGGASVLLFALVIAGGMAWHTLPPARETLRIPALSAPVAVSFDSHGIARIEAASEADAALALGYAHARDRLFQMELMRRTVSGRLAEWVGPAGLGSDRLMRTLGLRQDAEVEYRTLPPAVRADLDAYAAGVNAWLDARGRYACLECIFFRHLDPWTPVDSLLWGHLMGWYLAANERVELARIALAANPKLTPARIRALWPAQATAGRPDAAARDVRFAALAGGLLAAMPLLPAPFNAPAEESNAWAVDGAHSATGAPLLAGDPHLGFSFPGLWYLARIATPAGVWTGATVPGVPFLVLGQNGHIAWSFTSNSADTEDVFVETPIDPGHYLGPTGPLAFGLREERIKVRGAPDVVLTVRATRHGPVISDLIPGETRLLAVAMANLAGLGTAASGLYALDHAQSVEEAGEAAPQISAPVQNLMVADRTRIALFVTGRVPIRRHPEDFPPQNGADTAHDWIGWASGAALPHSIAPPSGHLVNANEEIAPLPGGAFLGEDWPGDWRARRIRALLAAKGTLSVADFSAIQADTTSAFAAEILPALRALAPPPGLAATALALLAGWQGQMDLARPEPLIFNAWMRRFAALVLSAAGVRQGDPAAPFLEFTASLFTPAGAATWCGGDCTPLLLRALEDATGDLARAYGPDPRAWRWGVAHQAVFAHPLLSRMPGLGRLATFRIADGGDDATIDRAAMAPESLDAVHGPSYRGVYDLANPDNSRFIIAPGESGNLLSRHAADLLTLWRDGAAITLPATPDSVTARLTLTP